MSDSDPSCPLIPIGPGPEEESLVQCRMQLEKQAEERTRLENAWATVRDWSTLDANPGDYFAFALAINVLVDCLGTQGLADRLDNRVQETKAKSDAQKIYQSLRDRNNARSVAERLEEVQRQAEQRDPKEREKWRAYGTALWYWLRQGLMKEILGEQLPPFEAYLNEFRSLNTPTALLEKCQELRARLAPSSPYRDMTRYEAPVILREIWAAMRRMGGEVPPAPELLKLDKGGPNALFYSFVKDQISEGVHAEDVLRSIDEVASWCVRRGATQSDQRNSEGEKRPDTTAVGQRAAVEKATARLPDAAEASQRIRWDFALQAPSEASYIKPHTTALFQAKLRVADFLRSMGTNPQGVSIEKLVVAVATTYKLAESDLAWAVYQLADEKLLEALQPADWSPHHNPYGSKNWPDGQGGFVHRVELPFDKGVVAPTEALWAWRREKDPMLSGLPEQLQVMAEPPVGTEQQFAREISDPIRMTITEAANYVGVSDRTIREWRTNGKLPVIEDEDGHLVFSKSTLDIFRNSRGSCLPPRSAD